MGAKVELFNADLSLIPFGIDLTQLQVTNPDEPMKNMVEVEHIRLAVEIGYLLQRKFVGEEMALDGVRFDTLRNVSGRLANKPPEKEKDKTGASASFNFPQLSFTDAKSVLEKEKLKTLIEAEKFKRDVIAEKKNYKKILQALPDKKKLEEYKARLNRMQGGKSLGNILDASGDLMAIKKDIEHDLNLLKQEKAALKEKISAYKARLERLKDMPKKDLARLKKKYAISPEGVGNMTLLLFGPTYSDWVTKGLSYYQKIKPYMEKKDASAKEAEEQPPARDPDAQGSIPDVLIRIARASLLLDAGTVQGEIQDIASDPVVYGKPVTFVFSGKNLKNIDDLNFRGTLDHTVSGQAMDKLSGSCKGYRLTSASISEDPSLPVTLKDALADVQLDITINNQVIDSKLVSDLNSVVFETGDRSDRSPVKAAAMDALSEISNFRVEARLEGTLEKNDISITSDVDRILENALKNVVKKQAQAFNRELKRQIKKNTAGKLKGLGSNIGEFGSISKELEKRLEFGDGLLADKKLF